jgi:hypothetical protein
MCRRHIEYRYEIIAPYRIRGVHREQLTCPGEYKLLYVGEPSPFWTDKKAWRDTQ